jgi:hypothetical protein
VEAVADAGSVRSRRMKIGAMVGFLVVFLVITGTSLALGVEGAVAVLIGFMVGAFVGGGLGLLIGGMAAVDDPPVS